MHSKLLLISKPESEFPTETGVQYFSDDNKIMGRVTAFNRNVKNIIFFYFNLSAFLSQYVKQNKQKDHGADLEITFKPTKNISLKAF